MPLSKETLQRMARELWAQELTPGEAEEVLVRLTPALESLAELDALDLESVEPAATFDASAPGPTGGPGGGEAGSPWTPTWPSAPSPPSPPT